MFWVVGGVIQILGSIILLVSLPQMMAGGPEAEDAELLAACDRAHGLLERWCMEEEVRLAASPAENSFDGLWMGFTSDPKHDIEKGSDDESCSVGQKVQYPHVVEVDEYPEVDVLTEGLSGFATDFCRDSSNVRVIFDGHKTPKDISSFNLQKIATTGMPGTSEEFTVAPSSTQVNAAALTDVAFG